MNPLRTLISLLLKSLFNLAAYEAEFRMKRLRSWALSDREKEARIVFLEDLVRKLLDEIKTLRELLLHQPKCHYSIRQRLLVLRFMEIYRIPRSKITEQFGIARSNLYRWLHQIQDSPRIQSEPLNKTPVELAKLIWKIVGNNPAWGRHRVAMQVWLLNVFVSASTVRNILKQPYPRKPESRALVIEQKPSSQRSIPAGYPNHVWSADITIVHRWGLWSTYVLVVIDHFSRKVLCVTPLEGPGTGWVSDSLEKSFRQFGAPKHLITDQGTIFKSDAFAELLDHWKVKHRFGAVGKHGSIAVTERVIETFKYEWIRRATLIRGFEHLQCICREFCAWYNEWRPHTRSGGATPEMVYSLKKWRKPDKDDKTVPRNIQTKLFHETGIVGFKIAA